VASRLLLASRRPGLGGMPFLSRDLDPALDLHPFIVFARWSSFMRPASKGSNSLLPCNTFNADILTTRAAINKLSKDLKSLRKSAQNSVFRFSIASFITIAILLLQSYSSFLIAFLSLLTKQRNCSTIAYIF
jgi:hypothetical protein